MSRIKDENYYQISGWMLNRLNLKGTELQVFAIIYGFSQDGESMYTGSLNYLSDWLGTSRPTTIKALKGLVDKGYILKEQLEMNGVTFNRYRANMQIIDDFRGSKETLPPENKLYTGSKESLPEGSKETLLGGSKETLPNNNSLNNNSLNNKENNNSLFENEQKKEPTSSKVSGKQKSVTNSVPQKAKKVDAFAVFAGEDNVLLETLRDFENMRKLIKKPMTDRAKTILVNKLEKEFNGRDEWIETLEQSIERNYSSVYPVKHNEPYKPKKANTANPDYSWGTEGVDFL